MLLNTFDPATTKAVLARLDKISFDTKPKWGKMNAAQMLAHLNVGYDLAYEKTKSNSSWFTKLMLKAFVKKIVVGDKPYTKNARTAPDFLITTEKEFEAEKSKLIDYINQTEEYGAVYFEGKESDSFGPLTSKEWSNLFYKHLDHHLAQFGV